MATCGKVKKDINQLKKFEYKHQLFLNPDKKQTPPVIRLALNWWPLQSRIGSALSRTHGNIVTPLIDGEEMMSNAQVLADHLHRDPRVARGRCTASEKQEARAV